MRHEFKELKLVSHLRQNSFSVLGRVAQSNFFGGGRNYKMYLFTIDLRVYFEEKCWKYVCISPKTELPVYTSEGFYVLFFSPCWETLKSYNPKILNDPVTQLNEGVPRTFCDGYEDGMWGRGGIGFARDGFNNCGRARFIVLDNNINYRGRRMLRQPLKFSPTFTATAWAPLWREYESWIWNPADLGSSHMGCKT